ncbi:MAG: ABC transporter permease, partial [Myxococcales bacterium]|nr:ABC transporter permease [Myxococcales bacterium]
MTSSTERSERAGGRAFALPFRVGRALAFHELRERTRDRWVIVISALFALLASAVGLYGRSAEGNAAAITGPSLVTLASLFVPLVALALGYDAIVGERERNTLGLLLSMPVGRTEVVVGKFVGRALALCLAVGLGLGAAMLAAAPGEARTLAALLGPTMALGLAFVSVGLLVSTLVSRQSTAASVVVAIWFLFVFFYDLGLLAILVATEGAIGDELVSSLVVGNPTGLYRVSLLVSLGGENALTDLGLDVSLPSAS